MTPAGLFTLTIAVTAASAAVDGLLQRRRSRMLRGLAAEWRLNYSAADPLHIASKVASHFPIPGAANLRVKDLIYGSERERYRYVFTAEFTAGVVRTKCRLTRVATFSEPRDRDDPDAMSPIILAPKSGTLLEQYQHLVPASARKAVEPPSVDQPTPASV